jgi:phenylacetate-CoA ligase
MFWDRPNETLPRTELEALQLQRLRDTVARVIARVPLYQQRLGESKVAPDVIRTLDDVRRLPFTTGADLRTIYPDGLLAVDRTEPVRLHTSSGTTGKPKAIFFSRNDVNNSAELIARSLVMTGITSKDVFQNMMSYGLFTGGLVMHYGAEKVGCLVIPSGPGSSERQLMLMQDFGVTAVHILPSYALSLPTTWNNAALIHARTCTSEKPLSGRNRIPRRRASGSSKHWVARSTIRTGSLK